MAGQRIFSVLRTILQSARRSSNEALCHQRANGWKVMAVQDSFPRCQVVKGGCAWILAASAGLFSASFTAHAGGVLSLEAPKSSASSSDPQANSKPRVVFVLGGPGSGKGTQCSKLVEEYGFVHLSAGDLLRAEIKSGSENGNMIQNMIKEGRIVPAEVTVALLQKAMMESGKNKFLIDGFPRNDENRIVFERDTGIDPEFILFFDCPEEVMEKRLLGRNEGRIDDNIETIRKRFKVFLEQSLPVVQHYESRGKVRKVDAAKPKDEVFVSLGPVFKPFIQDESRVLRPWRYC
eukprot:TRINITY_DN4740_c0_g1_i2.p1 TRINITY_DN4740_c0_g1~~TRINITY_DN4740_c0_g1_i2.p1  ORF type:complete len:292 (+),score=26.60 TRINITY_DN4740_c0_g1_i2:25-900(+)